MNIESLFSCVRSEVLRCCYCCTFPKRSTPARISGSKRKRGILKNSDRPKTNSVIKKSQNRTGLSTTWCSFGDSSLDIILVTISVGTKVSVELSTDGNGGGGGISGVGTTLSTTSSFGSVFSSSSPFATDSLFDSRLSIVLQ